MLKLSSLYLFKTNSLYFVGLNEKTQTMKMKNNIFLYRTEGAY